jgi:formylmethanofuran dehydrogenase subunit D
MAESFILIPGRTAAQGAGISEGKFGEKYQGQINVVLAAPEDLERLGIAEGESVRMRSEHGEADVEIKAAKPGDLPSGMLFIAYGDPSSRVMGSDTHGTGMPTSKGIDVSLERL